MCGDLGSHFLGARYAHKHQPVEFLLNIYMVRTAAPPQNNRFQLAIDFQARARGKM